MKRVLLALLFLVLIFAAYWFFIRTKPVSANIPKDQPLKIGGHSASFNNSIDGMLSDYFELADALVNADSAKALIVGKKLYNSFDSIPLDELKKDTALIFSTDSSNLELSKSFADSLINEKTLTQIRQDFSTISENLYPFLKGINYGGKKLYWYNCGMPFGENTSADWLSATEEKFNPYLGRFNGGYKSAMLHCGELQDSIVSK